MNTDSMQADNSSLRYWKAAIGTLPPAKRDAAWEFYLAHLEEGQATDTLIALILLLEANGAFLLTLPERFQKEMIYPLTERFDALRKELLADVERQQKALIEHDKVQESVKEAATLIDRSNGEFAGKIQAAIGAIDVTTLAREIIYTLKNETLYQIEGALRTLGSHTANTVEASEAAKRTIQAWRKLNLIGIALGAALAAVLLAGIAGVWGWWTMENHYRERLAAQIIRLDATDDAYRQALSLGFSMHLEPWVDEQGKPVESGYSIVIDGIDDALPRELDGQKSEVVRMKAVPLVRHVEAVIRQYEKLKK